MTEALVVLAVGLVCGRVAYVLGYNRGRWAVIERWARVARTSPEKLDADLRQIEKWDR